MEINKFDSDSRFKKDFVELTNKIRDTGVVDLENVDFDYLPTLRCNLRCKHCRQVEVRRNKEWKEIRDEMSIGQIKDMWDRIDIKGIIVKINGGEPFVKKEIFKILDYFKSRGTYNIIATNGAFFTKQSRIEKLKTYGLVEITTSLDGVGETHDKVRGFKNLFNIMANFIKEMAKEHKVLIECCLQKDNIGQLAELLKLKKDLGVYKIRFQLPVFTTKKEIQESSKALGEQLNYEAQIMEEPSYDFEYDDFMENYQIIKESGEVFDMHPKFLADDPEMPWLCFSRKVRSEYNLLCSYMFRAKIEPNGDLRFCPYIIKDFGNLKNDRFEDIWNSEDFKQFRKRILRNNLLPSCENCPHLRIRSKK